jgi:hypothetical protein
MALEARTRLGLYELQAPLGADGKGEVYRAKRASGSHGRDQGAAQHLSSNLAWHEEKRQP